MYHRLSKSDNPMKITELIELAAAAAGNQTALAKAMHTTPTRVSDWRMGRREATTGQIGLMAEIAGLPALETIAAVEAAQNSDFAALWSRIVGKMKAAGVTAAVTIVSAISLTMMPAPTNAATGGNGGIRTLDEALHPILP
jgi:hypothetical protein